MWKVRVPTGNIGPVLQFFEDLMDLFVKRRMNKIWCDLGERREHELTQVHTRVRQCQKRRVNMLAPK